MKEEATLFDLSHSRTIPPGLLLRTEADLSTFVERVKPIIESVRVDGDAALQRFARELDKVEAPNLNIRVSAAEISRAFELVPAHVIEALEFAIDNIRRFH